MGYAMALAVVTNSFAFFNVDNTVVATLLVSLFGSLCLWGIGQFASRVITSQEEPAMMMPLFLVVEVSQLLVLARGMHGYRYVFFLALAWQELSSTLRVFGVFSLALDYPKRLAKCVKRLP